MIRASLLSAFLLAVSPGPGWSEPARVGMQNCSPGASPDQRQRCDDEAFRQTEQSQITQLEGGWRLVKTRDPRGQSDAVSVIHVADTRKSDIGLAGLSLQCGNGGIEVVLIVVGALPLMTRQGVVLTAGNHRTELEATVFQGGEALRLPPTASKLVTGEWQSETELSVEIQTKPAPIRGAVPIGGLSTALRHLFQNCAAR